MALRQTLVASPCRWTTQRDDDLRAWEFQEPILGHISWGFSLKFRPQKSAKHIVGTSNLGS